MNLKKQKENGKQQKNTQVTYSFYNNMIYIIMKKKGKTKEK